MITDVGGREMDIYNEELISLEQAMELIRSIVEREKEGEAFYDKLLRNCQCLKESSIIAGMSREHIKHCEILRDLYTRLTGTLLPYISFIPERYGDISYREQLEMGLFQDLERIIKYRRVMGAMPDYQSYTLLMAIMTDMMRNTSRYNFLISNQNR